MVLHRHCRGRLIGDPLADGTEGNVEWNQLPQLPLGFPRGEAGFFGKRHFGTDWQKRLMRGGERLKSPQQYVEWCNLEHMSLIQLHSLTNLSPPLISQSCRFRSAVKPGSFPPGEAKNSEDFGDDHSTNCSIAGATGRQVEPSLRVRRKGNAIKTNPAYYLNTQPLGRESGIPALSCNAAEIPAAGRCPAPAPQS